MRTDELLSRLNKVRQTGHMKWQAQCPAHNDKIPSLAIKEVDGERILIHCFSGCSVGDIVAAVGMELTDLFPPRSEGSQPLQRPFFPIDVQDVLGFELSVFVLGMTKAFSGGLDKEDIDRMLLAAERLNGVLETVTGYPDRRFEEARRSYLCR